MSGETIAALIHSVPVAVVATVGADGEPHLALGSGPRMLDPDHLVFENWFCRTTLGNLSRDPRVTVAVVQQESGTGCQLFGRVVYGFDAAILDGLAPEMEPPGEPQTLTRLVVRVERVLSFCRGIDTDQPLEP